MTTNYKLPEPVGYVFKDEDTRNFYNSRIGVAGEFGHFALGVFTSEQLIAIIQSERDRIAAFLKQNLYTCNEYADHVKGGNYE